MNYQLTDRFLGADGKTRHVIVPATGYTTRRIGQTKTLRLVREQKKDVRRRLGRLTPKRCPTCKVPTRQAKVVKRSSLIPLPGLKTTWRRHCLDCGTRFGGEN